MAQHINEYAEAARSAATRTKVSIRRRQRSQQSQQDGDSGSKAQASQQLQSFDNLPDYLRDNEFIITGYRHTLPVRDTLKSFFNLHNETGNIWSHFIGFVLFLGLTVWMVRSPPTPVMLARPHLEQLWRVVSSNMQELRGSMEENLHQLQLPKGLQQSFLSGVQTLHDWEQTLQHRVYDLQESVQDSVYSFQGQVQSGAKAIAGQLQHGWTALIHESLVASDAVRLAATHWSLRQLLPAFAQVLQWPTPRWPMYVFCAGAMSCLFLSAFCHLLGCCQKHITTFIWRLDYTGIALLIVSSFYPTIYYAFLCQPYTAAIYLTTITLLGAAAVTMSLGEVFQDASWRPTRAILFVSLGLMGVVPLVHVMIMHGDVWHVRTFVFRDVFMGISYLAGAFIYAMRIPERWFPGKFDMLLHSHQIFHLCVVLGAYLHWRAALILLEWRDASGGCSMPVLRGPLNTGTSQRSQQGHDLLALDQVWEGLRLAAIEHYTQLMTGSPPQTLKT